MNKRPPYPFDECVNCYARPKYCNGHVAANQSGNCPLYIHPATPTEHRERGIKKLTEKIPF